MDLWLSYSNFGFAKASNLIIKKEDFVFLLIRTIPFSFLVGQAIKLKFFKMIFLIAKIQLLFFHYTFF
jgi:hypothetical protein